MSRIGKKPVAVPQGVDVQLNGSDLKVKGPKGLLAMTLVDDVVATYADGKISVQPKTDTKRARSMWGMQRTLVQGLVEGVTKGFETRLEIKGVGYRAAMKGKDVQLQLGFSHDVVYKMPEDVAAATPDQTTIIVSGIDKQKVGQVAAELRDFRKPEPYKGKGIRYSGEFVFRKEGKKK